MQCWDRVQIAGALLTVFLCTSLVCYALVQAVVNPGWTEHDAGFAALSAALLASVMLNLVLALCWAADRDARAARRRDGTHREAQKEALLVDGYPEIA